MVIEADPGFEQFFHGRFGRAVQLAERILGSRAAAEDVAAEAFARAFARWPRVRTLPHRDGWVLRVTTNLAIDAARRKRPTVQPAALSSSADDATVLRVALAAALGKLPRRQREAVALRYLSGLSEAEVALALGISAGAVKAHIHRGVRGLRARLGEGFREDDYAVTS